MIRPAYAQADNLRIERSAFDHIERGASFVIIGITPGAQQRDLADNAYARAIGQGSSNADASRIAKYAASFGGAMRTNLVRMLDHVRASDWLGLSSFSEAFDPRRESTVHFTSALRYPVFVDEKNYNGYPDMIATPILRQMIETHLAEEAAALPNAVWQPLGDKPTAALRHLVRLGRLKADQIAPSLPHPSGANAERIKYFLGEKLASDLSDKTNAVKIDELRKNAFQFYTDRN